MPEGWTSTRQISYPSTVSKRIDTFVTAGLPMASDIAVVILGQATIELLQPIRPHCNLPQVHHQAHRLVVGPRIHKLLELPPHTQHPTSSKTACNQSRLSMRQRLANALLESVRTIVPTLPSSRTRCP